MTLGASFPRPRTEPDKGDLQGPGSSLHRAEPHTGLKLTMTLKKALTSLPLYRQGNGSERRSNSPTGTQLAGGELKFKPESICLPSHALKTSVLTLNITLTLLCASKRLFLASPRHPLPCTLSLTKTFRGGLDTLKTEKTQITWPYKTA